MRGPCRKFLGRAGAVRGRAEFGFPVEGRA